MGRASSPHEMGETTSEFHAKIKNSTYRRLNYFSAIQPRPLKNMPGTVQVCADLKRVFKPERIRVVVLAPDKDGGSTSDLSANEIDGLRQLDIEVCRIDARRSNYHVEPGNVRQLADFFDFS